MLTLVDKWHSYPNFNFYLAMRDNSTLDQGVSTEMEGSRLVNDDFYEVRDLIGHFSELMNIIDNSKGKALLASLCRRDFTANQL